MSKIHLRLAKQHHYYRDYYLFHALVNFEILYLNSATLLMPKVNILR